MSARSTESYTRPGAGPHPGAVYTDTHLAAVLGYRAPSISRHHAGGGGVPPWPHPAASWFPAGGCGRLSPHSASGSGRLHFVPSGTWNPPGSYRDGRSWHSPRLGLPCLRGGPNQPDSSPPQWGPFGVPPECADTPEKSECRPSSSDTGEFAWCHTRAQSPAEDMANTGGKEFEPARNAATALAGAPCPGM